jgi:hypothetical protein
MNKTSSKPVVNMANYSVSLSQALYDLFETAIKSEYPDLEASVVIATSKVADYQCNSAMAISQVLKFEF